MHVKIVTIAHDTSCGVAQRSNLSRERELVVTREKEKICNDVDRRRVRTKRNEPSSYLPNAIEPNNVYRCLLTTRKGSDIEN